MPLSDGQQSDARSLADRYALEGQLGGGGMSVVHRARAPSATGGRSPSDAPDRRRTVVRPDSGDAIADDGTVSLG
jgi:hypothetical protein